jgi:hypothetical protein
MVWPIYIADLLRAAAAGVGRLRPPVPLLLAFLLAACGSPDLPEQAEPGASSREITIGLWAGDDTVESSAPATRENGPVTISGPFHLPHPVTGEVVVAFERIATTPRGPTRQLFTRTHDGAGFGRILDQRVGLPDRQFTGDLLFPLGEWTKGERRSFAATEYTPLGSARRLITIAITEMDYVYRGVPHSMAYFLSIEDAAGRVLACERHVYSPGIGLAEFRSAGIGPDGGGCSFCPCLASASSG